MNFREAREVNKLIDEIENLDSLIIDVQFPTRSLTVSTNSKGVRLENEHKTKVIQALLGIRGELAEKLEKLGVTEEVEYD